MCTLSSNSPYSLQFLKAFFSKMWRKLAKINFLEHYKVVSPAEPSAWAPCPAAPRTACASWRRSSAGCDGRCAGPWPTARPRSARARTRRAACCTWGPARRTSRSLRMCGPPGQRGKTRCYWCIEYVILRLRLNKREGFKVHSITMHYLAGPVHLICILRCT